MCRQPLRPSTAPGGSRDHTPSQQYAQKKFEEPSGWDLWQNLSSRSVGQLTGRLDPLHTAAGESRGARGARSSSLSCTCTTAAPTHAERPCAAGCISWRSLIEASQAEYIHARNRHTHACIYTGGVGGFFSDSRHGRAAPLFANNSRPTGHTLALVCVCANIFLTMRHFYWFCVHMHANWGWFTKPTLSPAFFFPAFNLFAYYIAFILKNICVIYNLQRYENLMLIIKIICIAELPDILAFLWRIYTIHILWNIYD